MSTIDFKDIRAQNVCPPFIFCFFSTFSFFRPVVRSCNFVAAVETASVVGIIGDDDWGPADGVVPADPAGRQEGGERRAERSGGRREVKRAEGRGQKAEGGGRRNL